MTQPTAVPTCYRHPDRETYITCARCSRPICPDCMIDASVGFQCPDCVADAQAQTRAPVTALGAPMVRRATVTQVLIGINVVVFVLELVAGLSSFSSQWGMSPTAVSFGGEWWRLLTAAFLHGGLLHIGFNMYVLWVIGPQLESLLGHARYLILYLMAALGGSVASFIFGPFNTLSVGASGAIFGLMAALIVAGRRLRADVTQIVVLLLINVVIGFLAPGVDWRAHLGGAVVGAAVAAVMAYAPAQSRVLWQSLGVLAILGLLVVVLMVRTAQLQTTPPGTSTTVPIALSTPSPQAVDRLTQV